MDRNVQFKFPFMSFDVAGDANTALAPTITVYKDDGVDSPTTGAATNIPVHLVNGLWLLTLTAAEMDSVLTAFTASGVGLASIGYAFFPEQNYLGPRAAKLDNADVAISTRLSTAGYTAPDNTTVLAIASGVTQVIQKLGTPAGASLAADIAAVLAAVVGIDAGTLDADGVDSITIESGTNLRQAVSLILAVITGKATVNGGTVTYKGGGVETDRVAITHDASGNRSASVLSRPN